MDSNRIGLSYRADAPAKLNLFLEVLAKRSDNFHEIETLMVAVSLRDTLYFTENQEGTVRLTCDWAPGMVARSGSAEATRADLGDLPISSDANPETGHAGSAETNTVWKAIRLLREAAGIDKGATVRIVKRVPAAAGLGGASSDAAAALLLANAGWKVGWNEAQLRELATEVGSDVPFFVGDRSRSMAVCSGRGEQIKVLPTATPLHVVVVRPPVGLSTPEVYARCRPAQTPVPIAPLVQALQTGRIVEAGRRLFNRLETTAAEISPWIDRLRHQLKRLDVLGHQMSGSGSSFFAVCRHRRQALRVANLLRATNVGRVFAAYSVQPQCRIAAVST